MEPISNLTSEKKVKRVRPESGSDSEIVTDSSFTDSRNTFDPELLETKSHAKADTENSYCIQDHFQKVAQQCYQQMESATQHKSNNRNRTANK